MPRKSKYTKKDLDSINDLILQGHQVIEVVKILNLPGIKTVYDIARQQGRPNRPFANKDDLK